MTNLTLEDMCWLMCGGPEEDESEEDNDQQDNDQQRSQENTDRSI